MEIFGKWLTPLNKENVQKDCILISNGWLALHHDNLNLTNAIDDIYSVFAYDVRGSGKSVQTGSMTVASAAYDMDNIFMQGLEKRSEIAEKYNVKTGKIIVLGSCLGGLTIAASFAKSLPISKMIDGIILISPISFYRANSIVKFGFFIPPVLVSGIIRFFSKLIIEKMFGSKDMEDTRKLAYERLKRIRPKVTLRQAREYIWRGNVTDAWKYITVPSMLIVGQNDPVAPRADSEFVYHKLNNCLWVSLDTPGHLLVEDNIDFLRENFSRFSEDPLLFYEKKKKEYSLS